MFPRLSVATHLPSFPYGATPYGVSPYGVSPYGVSPYGVGIGYGTISPTVPYLTSGPAPIPYPAIAPIPHAYQSLAPYTPGHIAAGISPWWSPLGLAQAAPAIHPAFAPPIYSIPATRGIVPQTYPPTESLLPFAPQIAPRAELLAALCGLPVVPPTVDPYSVMEPLMRSPMLLCPPQVGAQCIASGIPC